MFHYVFSWGTLGKSQNLLIFTLLKLSFSCYISTITLVSVLGCFGIISLIKIIWFQSCNRVDFYLNRCRILWTTSTLSHLDYFVSSLQFLISHYLWVIGQKFLWLFTCSIHFALYKLSHFILLGSCLLIMVLWRPRWDLSIRV